MDMRRASLLFGFAVASIALAFSAMPTDSSARPYMVGANEIANPTPTPSPTPCPTPRLVPCASPSPHVLEVQPGGPIQGNLLVRGPATVYFIPTNPLAPWFVTKNNAVINAPPVTFGTNVFTPIAPYESLIPTSTTSTQPPTASTTQPPANTSALITLALPQLTSNAILAGSVGCNPDNIPHGDYASFQTCVNDYENAAHDVIRVSDADAAAYDTSSKQLAALKITMDKAPSPRDTSYDAYRAYVRSNIMPLIGGLIRDMTAVRPLPSDQADAVNTGLVALIRFAAQNPDLRPTGKCEKHCKAVTSAHLKQEVRAMRTAIVNLRRYLSKSDYVAKFQQGLALIQNTFIPTLDATNIDRFAFSDTEDCRGTNSGGRITTYVLGQANGSTQTITVVCRPRVFLSTGFAFSSLLQQTFVGVPINPAFVPAPTPMPSGATPGPQPTQFSIISRGTRSDVRPIPMVMANVNLFGNEFDDTLPGSLYASFGVALSSTSSNTSIDYVGGLSYGLSRTLLFTVGAHLGDITELAPGYRLGDIIPLGTNPQTQTRTRVGIFVGITFGKQP